MNDSTHSIFRSAKRFFSGTLLSRMSGMARDIVMAFAFGTQESVAAFLVAFRFSHLLRRLLGEGALQSALIPYFEKLRQEDPYRAATFFRHLGISLSLLLSLLVILTMSVLWGVLLFVPLDPRNAEIIQLTLWMMPSLIFICLFGINAALLQCERSYFIPSVAPVAFNLCWILGIFCLWNFSSLIAMRGLTLFVNLACLAQWAVTLPKAIQSLKAMSNNLPSSFKLFSQDVLYLLKPMSLGLIGVGASQINNALDAVCARYAHPEGPAYLWYAIRIQQLPLALFGIAISGAMLPPLSRAIKNSNFLQFKEFLDFALRKSIAFMIPLSIALLVFGDHCINLIYGHGDFDSQAILGTSLCLWGYGLGLFPMALVLILAPAFYAQGDYKTPTYTSVFCILLNMGLNFFMVAILEYGAASVALATSLSAWVNLYILYVMLEKRVGYTVSHEVKNCFWKITSVSLLAGFTTCFVYASVLNENALWNLLKGETPHWTRSLLQQLSLLSFEILLFFGSLAGICYSLKIEDLLYLHKSEGPVQEKI